MKLGITLSGALGLAMAVGCGGTTEQPGIVLVDEGSLCVLASETAMAGSPLLMAAEAQRFEPGDRLHAAVSVPQCLSASCDVEREASCNIERRGSTLWVRSYLAYEHLEAESCTRDCGVLVAGCKSEPLEAGDYQVVHGDDAVPLRVPSSLDAPCR